MEPVSRPTAHSRVHELNLILPCLLFEPGLQIICLKMREDSNADLTLKLLGTWSRPRVEERPNRIFVGYLSTTGQYLTIPERDIETLGENATSMNNVFTTI